MSSRVIESTTDKQRRGVGLDDFVRLGIGVREARVGVIRRAANETTAAILAACHPLAREQNDERIAQVAASTYRLLDPRGRTELMQRVQLLHLESPPAEVKAWWKAHSNPVSPEQSVSDGFDPSAADQRYTPVLPQNDASWHTLLHRLGQPQAIAGRKALIAASACMIMLLLLGASMSLRSVDKNGQAAVDDGQPALNKKPVAALADVAAPVAPSDPQERESSSLANDASSEPTNDASSASTNDTPSASTDGVSSESTNDASSASTDDPSSASTNGVSSASTNDLGSASAKMEPAQEPALNLDRPVDAGRQPATQIESPKPAAPPAMDDSSQAERDDSRGLGEMLGLPLSGPAFDPLSGAVFDPLSESLLTDADAAEMFDPARTTVLPPEESDPPATAKPGDDEVMDKSDASENPDELIADESAVDNSSGSLDAKPSDVAKNDLANDTRHQQPSGEPLALARERLQRLLADLPPGNTENEQVANIRKMLQTASDSQAGSADRWVLLVHAAGELILMGRPSDSQAALDQITREYRTTDLQLRQSILDSLADSAATITQQERVISWAISSSDVAMRHEAFDDGLAILKTATTLAVKLGNVPLRSRVNQQADAIKQAKRMTQTASATMDSFTPETAPKSGANTVGRYRCFYLNDWDGGLPWLAECTSPKLVLVAKQELAAQGKVDRDLLNAWIDVANEMRGRSAESILLHTRNLASDALVKVSGLRAKDLESKIHEIDQMLPEDLRLPARSAISQAGGAGQIPGNDNQLGMLGRVSADGIDVGALIRYEPGLELSRSAFDQVLDQLGIKATIIRIEMVGLMDLPEKSTIRVATPAPGDADTPVSVMIDNQPVPLQAVAGQQRLAATVDLSQGTHLVRWSFGGKAFSSCVLELRNDRDNKPLSIVHTPALAAQVMGNSKPRLKVNIVGNKP